MDILCKCCDAVLLLLVKCSLVDSVGDHIITELPSGKLMKHQSLLACIDHRAIIEFLIFFGKLCFFSHLGKNCQYVVIYPFCSKIICKSFRDRYTVLCNSLCAALFTHYLLKIYCLYL